MIDPLDAFGVLELRVGEIIRAEPNDQARRPAYKLWIDFGTELGERQSSAQITALYDPSALVGRQIVAAMNLGEKRIAGFRSDVLVLGVTDERGDIVLLAPEQPAPNGARVH